MIINFKNFTMKKAFLALILIFSISTVFGSPPEYDVGNNDVVNVDNVIVNNMDLATVSDVVFVENQTMVICHFGNVDYVVSMDVSNTGSNAILNSDNENLFSTKHTNDIKPILQVPWQSNTFDNHDATILEFKGLYSSGGLPYNC